MISLSALMNSLRVVCMCVIGVVYVVRKFRSTHQVCLFGLARNDFSRVCVYHFQSIPSRFFFSWQVGKLEGAHEGPISQLMVLGSFLISCSDSDGVIATWNTKDRNLVSRISLLESMSSDDRFPRLTSSFLPHTRTLSCHNSISPALPNRHIIAGRHRCRSS